MMKIISALIIFTSIAFLNSCGKSSEEEISGAILSANISLSKGDCQSAIDTLSAIAYQSRNASFLKTLSAAYACRAGFSVIQFFANDLVLTATHSPTLGGMSIYSTSLTTVSGALENNSSFSDLQRAIDILLYAGGISTTAEPLSSERAKNFGSKDLSEINSQLAFMLMAQLGKYMHFYADTSTTGVKGAGTLSNNCFTSYQTAHSDVTTFLGSGATGACSSNNSGHPLLNSSVAAATRAKRMCQGVVLMNSMLDVLPGVIASAGGGDLSSVPSLTTLTTAIAAVVSSSSNIGNSIVLLTGELSQANCETAVNSNAAGVASAETFFAIYFESLQR
jgi:hypothetical protein